MERRWRGADAALLHVFWNVYLLGLVPGRIVGISDFFDID
jgi:hypothetical protein